MRRYEVNIWNSYIWTADGDHRSYVLNKYITAMISICLKSVITCTYNRLSVERCSGILGEVKIFLNNIKLYSIKFENETFIGNF